MNTQITLVGNISSEFRITNFNSGNKIIRFGVETEEYKCQKVFAWGNMANFIEKFGKLGKEIIFKGRIVERSKLTKKGIKKTNEIEIVQILTI